MSKDWQWIGVSLVSLAIGLVGGACLGVWLTIRAWGGAADRIVFDLRQSASLLATEDGSAIDDAVRLEKTLYFVQSDTAALGLMFGDIATPGARDVAIKTLKRIDANPYVRADEKNRGAKIARECLLAEAAKPKPDYADCAAKVRNVSGYVATR